VGLPSGTSTATTPSGSANTDPGRVTLHRLNRVEYNNTVHDLLGTSLTPATDFPPDDRGYGFDNMADVLSLSPLQLDLYYGAAETLVSDTLGGAQRKKLVSCDLSAEGASCADKSLRTFARKAFRRPVTDAEVKGLMALVSLAQSKGDSVEAGLKLALQAVLTSPHFVFRVELDPSPTSTTPHPLTPHELATRLSYFLWSSMPDDELTALADDGTLTKADVLRAQAARMLKSDKAKSLVSNFGGQWLYTRKVDEVQPDSTRFPTFNAALRTAMRRETELLFEQVVFNALPADKLLTASFTYMNDALAKHYGLPAVGSSELKRVDLTTEQRGGLLSHASVLTVNSHATNTSPVLRGKWVINQLLCQEVPPPPPGVDTKSVNDVTAGGSLRKRLEQHRANPVCASCHAMMDPIGFGLENYDAIGAYRTLDGNVQVDASGTLPDGSAFKSPKELAAIVAEDERFPACVAQMLYSYALGRPPDYGISAMDTDTLANLAQKFQAGFDFTGLVLGIVTSEPFQMRRGEAATGAKP
jgi:hypothetical protein